MPRLKLRVEVLEDRSVPSVFTVTSAFDNGAAGTLRWAIVQANAHPNSLNIDNVVDEVHFSLPGPFPHVLQLNAPLPAVTEPVLIDGWTQPVALTNSVVDQQSLYLDGPMPQDPNSRKFAIVRGIVTNDQRVFPPPTEVDNFPPKFRPRFFDPSLVVPLLPKREDDPPPPLPSLAKVFTKLGDDELAPPPARLPDQFRRIGGAEPGIFLPGQEQLTGKILGELFEDHDGNGLRGEDEPPLAGRVVFIDLNQNGKLDDGEPTTVTNDKGEYRFIDLRPATYTVRQVLQPHLVQTLPAKGEGNWVELHAGETVMEVDFGTVKVQRRRVEVSTESEATEQEMGPQSDAQPGDDEHGELLGSGAALLALGWGLKSPRKQAEQQD